MKAIEEHRIDADVAVIGGGTAGLHTAMAAAECGLKVLVAKCQQPSK